MLELAGYEVQTAADGLQAWSELGRGAFDALVSDVSMPGLTGFQLCERVRSDAAHKRLPVVLVTSMQSPAEKERGLLAGADAYLSKGAFDRDALLATLARLVGTGVP
jgi:two-component system, chemotaxis family, sensor kinase CheA